jgi:DNA (cytosine-5)-methyltransferase 1
MPEERSDGRTNALTSVRKDNIVSIDSGIRYLTPLECERLMGWPDNWTKYGIDEKGNIVELSDNARYNLIGNGVVPQVVREIVRHIMNEPIS